MPDLRGRINTRSLVTDDLLNIKRSDTKGYITEGDKRKRAQTTRGKSNKLIMDLTDFEAISEGGSDAQMQSVNSHLNNNKGKSVGSGMFDVSQEERRKIVHQQIKIKLQEWLAVKSKNHKLTTTGPLSFDVGDIIGEFTDSRGHQIFRLKSLKLKTSGKTLELMTFGGFNMR